MHASIAALEG